MMAQLVVEVGQLALRGQVALEQQPSRFFKTAFTRQRLHGDAAVLQAGPFAVDETDGRLGGGHVGKARPILDLTHSLPTLNQGVFRVRGCGGSLRLLCQFLAARQIGAACGHGYNKLELR